MDRAARVGQSPHEFAKAFCIGRGCSDGDPLAAFVEYTDIQSFFC